jgi:hypothetical protein
VGGYFFLAEKLPLRALSLPPNELNAFESRMLENRVASILELYAKKHSNRSTDDVPQFSITLFLPKQSLGLAREIIRYPQKWRMESKLVVSYFLVVYLICFCFPSL